MKLRLGTRGSDLALTQSRWVAAELARAGIESELVVISTSGDRSAAPSFGAIGPQGVFVREIEQALIDGTVDFAVHSFKDLPTQSPPGLTIAAVPPRRDPADWLLTPKGRQLEKGGQSPISAERSDAAMPPGNWALTPFFLTPFFGVAATGSKIGTASARRQAWIRHFAPGLEIASLRGNVPTRLRRLVDGDFDAILLAGAGIERLAEATDVLDAALAGIESERLDPAIFVPAPAQGALAVQCRDEDAAIRGALAAIDDAATRTAIDLERTALALAEGGCDTAFGAYAVAVGGDFDLAVMIERGGAVLTNRVSGPADATLAERAMAGLGPSARSGG